MQIRFRGIGRRPALVAIFAAVLAVALPVASASATPQPTGTSDSYITTDVSILGPQFTTSTGTIPAQTATLTDNVVFSGSITGNSTATFYDFTCATGATCPEQLGPPVQLVSNTNGSNTTACTTSNGGNKNGCYASITVSGDQLQPGPNTIEAVFPGDSLTQGSTGFYTLYGALQANEKNCLAGTSCSFTEGVDSTSSTFSSPSGNSGELLSMVFGQDSLPAGCPTLTNPPAGTAPDDVIYNVTNAGLVNQFSYVVTSTPTADWATYLYNQYTANPSARVCFESSADFQAYSASGGTVSATQQLSAKDSNGNSYPIPDWAGEVANCVYSHKNSPPTFLPCLASATYKSASKTKPATFTQVVDVPPIDSKLHY